KTARASYTRFLTRPLHFRNQLPGDYDCGKYLMIYHLLYQRSRFLLHSEFQDTSASQEIKAKDHERKNYYQNHFFLMANPKDWNNKCLSFLIPAHGHSSLLQNLLQCRSDALLYTYTLRCLKQSLQGGTRHLTYRSRPVNKLLFSFSPTLH